MLAYTAICQRLTPRQIECWGYWARGESIENIAEAMGVSHSTVDNHIAAILDRLPARNRCHAAGIYWDVAEPLTPEQAAIERHPLDAA